MKSAEAELLRAETELRRVTRASESNAVSDMDVDTAQASRDKAEAGLMSAKAVRSDAELELSYTKVRSPIQGQVGRNLVDAGNLVGQSGPGIIMSGQVATTETVGAGRDVGGPGAARVFKWVSLGLGVGAAAGGAVLIAMDGRGTCDAPAGVSCPDEYQTLGGGVGMVLGSAALAATSVYLFFRDARRRIVKRQRVTNDGNLYPFRLPRQDSAH